MKPFDDDWGTFVEQVLKIKTRGEMLQFAEAYVDHLVSRGYSLDNALEIMRDNIGYCFGEGMTQEIATMWYETTRAEHPAVGHTLPTTVDGWYKAGQEWMAKFLGRK